MEIYRGILQELIMIDLKCAVANILVYRVACKICAHIYERGDRPATIRGKLITELMLHGF